MSSFSASSSTDEGRPAEVERFGYGLQNGEGKQFFQAMVDGYPELAPEGPDVLMGADHFHAEQDDEPAGVDPDHEYGEDGQGPVDGVVFGNADLEMDIPPLDELPEGPCQDPADQRRLEADLGVGNEDVEKNQGGPDADVLQEPDAEEERVSQVGIRDDPLDEGLALQGRGEA